MIAIMDSAIANLFHAAPLRQWEQGQTLFRVGDRPIVLHLVASGRVALARMLADGTELTLQSAAAGNVLAEASACAQTYHSDARAMVASQTGAVDLQEFRAAVDRQAGLAAAWPADLGRAVQQARFRIEVRSLRTVRARLDAWLSEGRVWPLSGQMQDIAGDIGVAREALYRELARRRRDKSAALQTAAARQGLQQPLRRRFMRTSLVADERSILTVAATVGLDPDQLQRDMRSSQVQAELDQTRALADVFGFIGTPGLVIGRTVLMGAVPMSLLQHVIADERSLGPLVC